MKRKEIKEKIDQLSKEINLLSEKYWTIEDDNEKEKNKSIRKELSNEMNELEWRVKTNNEKHEYRIGFWLSQARRYNTDDLNRRLFAINLYEKIRETIPYVLLLSNSNISNTQNALERLIKLCKKEIKLINKGSLFLDVHVSKEEINEAFNDFFENVKTPAEYESIITHPEAEKKIEELYDLFVKL